MQENAKKFDPKEVDEILAEAVRAAKKITAKKRKKDPWAHPKRD